MSDARKTKQTGYDVQIRAFVPADLADTKKLAELQDTVATIKRAFGDRVSIALIPTRRYDA